MIQVYQEAYCTDRYPSIHSPLTLLSKKLILMADNFFHVILYSFNNTEKQLKYGFLHILAAFLEVFVPASLHCGNIYNLK